MDETSEEVEGSEDEWKYDLAVDILLAFGIALNVYFIVDVASNGQLSRDVMNTLRRFRVQLTVLAHKDQVIQEAHEALYETEEDLP